MGVGRAVRGGAASGNHLPRPIYPQGYGGTPPEPRPRTARGFQGACPRRPTQCSARYDCSARTTAAHASRSAVSATASGRSNKYAGAREQPRVSRAKGQRRGRTTPIDARQCTSRPGRRLARRHGSVSRRQAPLSAARHARSLPEGLPLLGPARPVGDRGAPRRTSHGRKCTGQLTGFRAHTHIFSANFGQPRTPCSNTPRTPRSTCTERDPRGARTLRGLATATRRTSLQGP